MKLIMHNFLACNIRGVKNGYPLEIEATKVEMRDADFDPEFIRKIMERVNYDVLRNAVTQMGLPVELPAQLDRDRLQNDDDNILQHLHHTLFEAHLEEGNLVCPESGRKFPISKGIANMLLHADEVCWSHDYPDRGARGAINVKIFYSLVLHRDRKHHPAL